MKKLFNLILVLLMFNITAYSYEIAYDVTKVKTLKKQRILIQKILKNYCMISGGVSFGDPKEDLNTSIGEFRENLNFIRKESKDKKILDAISKTEKSWSKVETILHTTNDKSKIIELKNLLDKLLLHSNDTLSVYTEKFPNKTSNFVNISQKQSELSQQIMAFYMLHGLKIEGVDAYKELELTVEMFENAHDKLNSNKNNNQNIKTLLQKINRNFMFVKMQTSTPKMKFSPSLMYKKTNAILKLTDELTLQYTKKQKAN